MQVLLLPSVPGNATWMCGGHADLAVCLGSLPQSPTEWRLSGWLRFTPHMPYVWRALVDRRCRLTQAPAQLFRLSLAVRLSMLAAPRNLTWSNVIVMSGLTFRCVCVDSWACVRCAKLACRYLLEKYVVAMCIHGNTLQQPPQLFDRNRTTSGGFLSLSTGGAHVFNVACLGCRRRGRTEGESRRSAAT